MITLSSDFGEHYPAAMRGVLLQRSNARLVDVSHDLPRGEIRGSAFWLQFLLPEFPPAVHLVVVDPGVGTDRAAIVLRVGGHALVGPDNGVLIPAVRAIAPTALRGTEDPISIASNKQIDAFRIQIDDPASQTFHGRDVFAPAAATVHELGSDAAESAASLEPIEDVVGYSLPSPQITADTAHGEVLVVDGFGNVITNVSGDFLAGVDTVRVNGDATPVGSTFGSVPEGKRLVTVGSHGHVECDVNNDRGTEAFGLEAGDPVRIER
jgi:S-adenosylmethionine hydrolase